MSVKEWQLETSELVFENGLGVNRAKLKGASLWRDLCRFVLQGNNAGIEFRN